MSPQYLYVNKRWVNSPISLLLLDLIKPKPDNYKRDSRINIPCKFYRMDQNFPLYTKVIYFDTLLRFSKKHSQI